jgi:hypothetical protein
MTLYRKYNFAINIQKKRVKSGWKFSKKSKKSLSHRAKITDEGCVEITFYFFVMENILNITYINI